MMIDKFETREEDGKLCVYVEVAHERLVANIPRIRIETSDIQALLTEKGIKYGECIVSTTLKNWREHTRKKEWIFEIPLDKSPEPVIIVEEKSVQPKSKRSSRTRSSTKKVSTEE